MFDGHSRGLVHRIREGCPTHPTYKGNGEPPYCGRCHSLHAAWAELVGSMEALLNEALRDT